MKIYNENGHLNEYGKNVLDEYLGKELHILMNSETTAQELMTLKSILTKYVGDKLSERMFKVKSTEIK
jgi:hypothetical protein